MPQLKTLPEDKLKVEYGRIETERPLDNMMSTQWPYFELNAGQNEEDAGQKEEDVINFDQKEEVEQKEEKVIESIDKKPVMKTKWLKDFLLLYKPQKSYINRLV